MFLFSKVILAALLASFVYFKTSFNAFLICQKQLPQMKGNKIKHSK